jgi:hypothetical protein
MQTEARIIHEAGRREGRSSLSGRDRPAYLSGTGGDHSRSLKAGKP